MSQSTTIECYTETKTLLGLEHHQRKRADRLQLENEAMREQAAEMRNTVKDLHEKLLYYECFGRYGQESVNTEAAAASEERYEGFAEWEHRKELYETTIKTKDAEITQLQRMLNDPDPEPPSSPGEDENETFVTDKRYRAQKRRNRHLAIFLEDQQVHNVDLYSKYMQQMIANDKLRGELLELRKLRRQEAMRNRNLNAELARWTQYGSNMKKLYASLAQRAESYDVDLKHDKDHGLASNAPLPNINDRELADPPDTNLRLHPWLRLTGGTSTEHWRLGLSNLRFCKSSDRLRVSKRSSKPARLSVIFQSSDETSVDYDPMDLDGDQEMTDSCPPQCGTCGQAVNDATATKIVADYRLFQWRQTIKERRRTQ